LEGSYIVGDRTTDLQAGLAAGVQPILVLTGDGQTARDQWEGNVPVVEGIWDAAEVILADGAT